MWVGTNGGGLCSFDPKTETFIDFDPDNTILPNRVIYSIEQDKTGDFWISSNAGLITINPITKQHFRQFTVNDGLQGNQFTAQSSLKTASGKLYFGGISGFNSFVPDQFMDNQYIPSVYITEIRLPYTTDERLVQDILHLEGPLYRAETITLPYEHNTFSVSFVALSYEDPLKNRYSYRLKGVDKEWVINSEQNTASYTNLPPGKYEFEVRGSNNDHKWNDQTTSLLIVVTPPWWLTTWAYCVYTLLLLGLAYYAGWHWNRHVKKKYKRRMEEYQTTKEKEVYKSKISFFINLVHEIRTPLSLIRLPLEKLLEDKREGRDAQLYVGASSALLLGLYSFTLPPCPPAKNQSKTLLSSFGLDALSLFKRKKMAIFFFFSMLLGAALQITNTYGDAFLGSFAKIPEFADSFGVKHSVILLSISQMSETLFILAIPFFLKHFGIKRVMLISMFAWVFRFGLFGFGDPGSGIWMLILSMIVYGMAFDFFNISGSLFVELETKPETRASAQGLFFIMTNGLGAVIGGYASGAVVDAFSVYENGMLASRKASMQSRAILHEQEYLGKLPAGEKEEGHRPGDGVVRLGGRTLLVRTDSCTYI